LREQNAQVKVLLFLYIGKFSAQTILLGKLNMGLIPQINKCTQRKLYWQKEKFKVWDNLIGQIKHEFNSTNKQMYTEEALLAEGKI